MLTQSQQQAIDLFFNEKSKILFPLARYMVEQNIRASLDHYAVTQKKLEFLNSEFNSLNPDWVFVGYRDYKQFGAGTCSLGHPLRYGYLARNKRTGEVIQFGIKCLSDFFDVKEEVVKALNKLSKALQEEQKKYMEELENNIQPQLYLIPFLTDSHCDLVLKNYYLNLLKNNLPIPASDLAMIQPEYASYQRKLAGDRAIEFFAKHNSVISQELRTITGKIPASIKYLRLYDKIIKLLNGEDFSILTKAELNFIQGLDLVRFAKDIAYIFNYPADKIVALGEEGIQYLNNYAVSIYTGYFNREDYSKTLKIAERLRAREEDKGGLLQMYLSTRFTNLEEIKWVKVNYNEIRTFQDFIITFNIFQNSKYYFEAFQYSVAKKDTLNDFRKKFVSDLYKNYDKFKKLTVNQIFTFAKIMDILRTN